MKEKIFNALKQEYKALGLSDEILQGHANALAAIGLVTDENLSAVVAAQKDFLTGLQSGIDKRVTTAREKALADAKKTEDEAKAEAERKKAEEDAKKADKDKPEWQKEMEKRFEEFLKKDTERESAYKALKEKYDILEKKDAESARANTILSKAKELGIPEWRIKEGFAISAEADEAAINSHLTTVATNLKTANLPSNRLGHVLDDGKPSKEQISDIANSLIH
jgi:hypothetical protein